MILTGGDREVAANARPPRLRGGWTVPGMHPRSLRR